MDLGVAIIGGIMILMCIIPIIVMHNNKKKKEKKVISALYNFAQSNSCSVSVHDIWLNTAIGIDKNNKFLFFLKGNDKSHHIQKIDLAAIRAVNILPIDGIDRVENVEILELALFPESDESAVLLEFFNSNVSIQLADELLQAKKWRKIITETIPS